MSEEEKIPEDGEEETSLDDEIEDVEELDDLDLDLDEDIEEDLDAFELEELPELGEVEEAGEVVEEEDIFREEIELERFYTVPLAKGFMKAPKWKRTKKAMKYLKEFLTQHMKPIGNVYIAQDLNERIWENGIKNPPRKVRVRATKSIDGIVRAYLAY